MKRYRFRLEPVLRVRRTQEETARGQLLAAQAAVATQEQLLEARRVAYTASLTAPDGPQDRNAFLAAQAHRKALASAVLEQGRRLVEAGEDAAQAHRAWSACAVRVGALERLDERARREHAAATLKEDDLATDDLVVARHGRNER